MNNTKFREKLFLHLDGIAILPVIYELKKSRITNYIYKNQYFSIKDISKNFNVNPGYINICLRTLRCAGFISLHNDNKIDTKKIYIYKLITFRFNYFFK